MSVVISASQAALLVGRHERIVRGWILSKRLPATKPPGSTSWQINTDDLIRVDLVDQEHKEIIRRWAERKAAEIAALAPVTNASVSSTDEAINRVKHLEELVKEMANQHERHNRNFQELRQEQTGMHTRISRLEQEIERILGILQNHGINPAP